MPTFIPFTICSGCDVQKTFANGKLMQGEYMYFTESAQNIKLFLMHTKGQHLFSTFLNYGVVYSNFLNGFGVHNFGPKVQRVF